MAMKAVGEVEDESVYVGKDAIGDSTRRSVYRVSIEDDRDDCDDRL